MKIESQQDALVSVSAGGHNKSDSELVKPPAGAKTASGDHTPSILDRTWLRTIFLFILTQGVLFGGAVHTLCAQPFKNSLGIPNLSVPWYHTFVTMSSWPVAMIAWMFASGFSFQIPRFKTRMKAFFILAALDAVNTGFGSYGLNAMSAATYSILRGSGLIFAVVLSLLLTSKKFNFFHYLGVLLMSVAMVTMAFAKEEKTMRASHSVTEKMIAWSCTLISSFFVSLLNVLTQKLFADENAKGSFEFICQVNAFQSLFSFVLCLPIVLLQSEVQLWPEYAQKVHAEGAMVPLVLLSLGMFFARPIMIFSNIACTSLSSATFVRTLGGPKRLVVVVLAYLICGQAVYMPTVWAAVFMTVSMFVYVYGGMLQANEKKEMRQRARDEAEVEVTTLK